MGRSATAPISPPGRRRKAELHVISWNINSIRVRLHNLARLVHETEPDVICLQETKVADPRFPRAAVAELGYPHLLVRGEKGYNGVAILSRLPLEPLDPVNWCGRDDARHLAARLRPGSGAKIEIHNFYVPAGGDAPDPAVNDKFAHKLAFLDEMADWFARRNRSGNRVLLAGDLNVAPLQTDVWSHKQLLKVVSHTPVEVARLAHLMEVHDWVDAARRFTPSPERLYSWWSYRARDWSKSDRGRRLDHIWVTPALVPALESADILRPVRGWPRASDHAPVRLSLRPDLSR
jgi:exodeoxyribonuclease-3